MPREEKIDIHQAPDHDVRMSSWEITKLVEMLERLRYSVDEIEEPRKMRNLRDRLKNELEPKLNLSGGDGDAA